MFKFISFLIMAKIKLVSHLFYRGKEQWLSKESWDAFKDVNLMVLLNHTSLFEPLFLRFAPWKFVWKLSQNLVVPGADITMDRPLTGKVFKALMPGCIPITRKKDDSWELFLSHVNDKVLTAILPEGRMKRRNGLDKHGKPMSVRGGVADILQRLTSGKILFVYSGGLHHIQTPGERFPRLFKNLTANMEILDLQTYKNSLIGLPGANFKEKVMSDMNRRLYELVP